MSIDLQERMFTLSEGMRRFPKSASGKCPSTVSGWRWATKGVRGGIKLRTVAVGGKRYVPESAISEFLEACSRAANHETPSAPAPRTNRQRAADIKAAEKVLSKDGI